MEIPSHGGILRIPPPQEVYGRSNTTVYEIPGEWTQRQADFIYNTSGVLWSHSLFDAKTSTRHGVYLSDFTDALVFGHHHLHTIISNGFYFDCQDIENYWQRLEFHVKHHPGRSLPIPQITSRDSDFYIDFEKVTPSNISCVEGEVLFCTPIEPLNWGMWLLQALPAAASFLRGQLADRLFIFCERTWQRALLTSIGLPEKSITHHDLGATYFIKKLKMFQYSRIELVPTPLDRNLYDSLATLLAPEAAPIPFRKIFLSRKSITAMVNQGRALLNETEIISAMEDLGFEIWEPEKLSFSDQIRLFRESRVVVGLGGAALFNVVFCRPGTMVVSVEGSTQFVHGHASLFAALDHRYGFVIGVQDVTDRSPVHKRWTVDRNQLVDLIKTLG